LRSLRKIQRAASTWRDYASLLSAEVVGELKRIPSRITSALVIVETTTTTTTTTITTKLWKVPRDTSASAASAARHRELYIVPPAVVIVVELFSLCASRLSGNGKTSDNASHRLAPSPPNIEEIVPIVLIVRRRSCFAYRGRKQPRSTRTQVRFLSRPCYSTFVLSRGTAARGTSLHVERRVRVPLLRGPRIDDFGGTERTSPLSQATSTCNFWPRKRIGLLIKLTLAPTRIATGLDNSSV